MRVTSTAAMVLAAGLGSRLGSITTHTPKCLVEAGGVPMIEHTFVRLRSQGVSSFVVNQHHLAEKVDTYLDAYSAQNPGFQIHRSRESVLLDTGGGVKAARHWLASSKEGFYVHNADVFTDASMAVLPQAVEAGAGAALLVIEQESSRGLLINRKNELCGWVKKGERIVVRSDPDLRLVNFTGIQFCGQVIFEWMENCGEVFSIIEAYLEGVRRGAIVSTVSIPAHAHWFDVGTPERLTALDDFLTSVKK